MGVLAGDQGADRVLRDVGGEQEEADRDEAFGASFGVCESRRMPVKRQITITDASASIAESRPKPSSATEPARIAAVIAIAPSAVM